MPQHKPFDPNTPIAGGAVMSPGTLPSRGYRSRREFGAMPRSVRVGTGEMAVAGVRSPMGPGSPITFVDLERRPSAEDVMDDISAARQARVRELVRKYRKPKPPKFEPVVVPGADPDRPAFIMNWREEMELSGDKMPLPPAPTDLIDRKNPRFDQRERTRWQRSIGNWLMTVANPHEIVKGQGLVPDGWKVNESLYRERMMNLLETQPELRQMIKDDPDRFMDIARKVAAETAYRPTVMSGIEKRALQAGADRKRSRKAKQAAIAAQALRIATGNLKEGEEIMPGAFRRAKMMMRGLIRENPALRDKFNFTMMPETVRQERVKARALERIEQEKARLALEQAKVEAEAKKDAARRQAQAEAIGGIVTGAIGGPTGATANAILNTPWFRGMVGDLFGRPSTVGGAQGDAGEEAPADMGSGDWKSMLEAGVLPPDVKPPEIEGASEAQAAINWARATAMQYGAKVTDEALAKILAAAYPHVFSLDRVSPDNPYGIKTWGSWFFRGSNPGPDYKPRVPLLVL